MKINDISLALETMQQKDEALKNGSTEVVNLEGLKITELFPLVNSPVLSVR